MGEFVKWWSTRWWQNTQSSFFFASFPSLRCSLPSLRGGPLVAGRGASFSGSLPTSSTKGNVQGPPSAQQGKNKDWKLRERKTYPTPAHGTRLVQGLWIFMNAQTKWTTKLQLMSGCHLHWCPCFRGPPPRTHQTTERMLPGADFSQVPLGPPLNKASTLDFHVRPGWVQFQQESCWVCLEKTHALDTWPPSRSDQMVCPPGSHRPPPSAGRLPIPRHLCCVQSWVPSLSLGGAPYRNYLR